MLSVSTAPTGRGVSTNLNKNKLRDILCQHSNLNLMQKIINVVFGIFVSLLLACAPSEKAEVVSMPKMPEVLEKALVAHGGLEQWQAMESLEYTFARDSIMEVQKTALHSRKAYIKRGDVFTLGFNGDSVWVQPNREAYGKGDPRFYHNLLFYFYAMPFVLADPGIIYETLPPRQLNGKSYPALKISYGDGVGDAPDDYYIAHFDPDTYKLHLLLYTVTYFDQLPNEKYKALAYDEWTNVNGLELPKKMIGYKFADDALGEQRYVREFVDIKVSKEKYPDDLFER